MHHADVVELVDTLDSGSSAREGMKVQVLSSASKPGSLTAGFLFWAGCPYTVSFLLALTFDERYGMR